MSHGPRGAAMHSETTSFVDIPRPKIDGCDLRRKPTWGVPVDLCGCIGGGIFSLGDFSPTELLQLMETTWYLLFLLQLRKKRFESKTESTLKKEVPADRFRILLYAKLIICLYVYLYWNVFLLDLYHTEQVKQCYDQRHSMSIFATQAYYTKTANNSYSVNCIYPHINT